MTCWTEEKNSVAMWSLYSPTYESIMVKTSIKKLRKSVNEFAKSNFYMTQWDRPAQDLVTWGHSSLRKANYVSLKKVLNDIKIDIEHIYSRYIHNGQLSNIIIKDIHNCLECINEKFSLKTGFLKDISFSHEKEIRAEIQAGVRELGTTSYEDWKINGSSKGIPISYDRTGSILPSIIHLDLLDEDFIEEVIFDPRIPSYKKNTLMKMLNITENKIGTSECFSPIITKEFKFNPFN